MQRATAMERKWLGDHYGFKTQLQRHIERRSLGAAFRQAPNCNSAANGILLISSPADRLRSIWTHPSV